MTVRRQSSVGLGNGLQQDFRLLDGERDSLGTGALHQEPQPLSQAQIVGAEDQAGCVEFLDRDPRPFSHPLPVKYLDFAGTDFERLRSLRQSRRDPDLVDRELRRLELRELGKVADQEQHTFPIRGRDCPGPHVLAWLLLLGLHRPPVRQLDCIGRHQERLGVIYVVVADFLLVLSEHLFAQVDFKIQERHLDRDRAGRPGVRVNSASPE